MDTRETNIPEKYAPIITDRVDGVMQRLDDFVGTGADEVDLTDVFIADDPSAPDGQRLVGSVISEPVLELLHDELAVDGSMNIVKSDVKRTFWTANVGGKLVYIVEKWRMRRPGYVREIELEEVQATTTKPAELEIQQTVGKTTGELHEQRTEPLTSSTQRSLGRRALDWLFRK